MRAEVLRVAGVALVALECVRELERDDCADGLRGAVVDRDGDAVEEDGRRSVVVGALDGAGEDLGVGAGRDDGAGLGAGFLVVGAGRGWGFLVVGFGAGLGLGAGFLLPLLLGERFGFELLRDELSAPRAKGSSIAPSRAPAADESDPAVAEPEVNSARIVTIGSIRPPPRDHRRSTPQPIRCCSMWSPRSRQHFMNLGLTAAVDPTPGATRPAGTYLLPSALADGGPHRLQCGP